MILLRVLYCNVIFEKEKKKKTECSVRMYSRVRNEKMNLYYGFEQTNRVSQWSISQPKINPLYSEFRRSAGTADSLARFGLLITL